MNERSSRSHAIFIITVECGEVSSASIYSLLSEETEGLVYYNTLGLFKSSADGSSHIRVGKLNLVDLAGSERQAKTGAVVRLFYICYFV